MTAALVLFCIVDDCVRVCVQNSVEDVDSEAGTAPPSALIRPIRDARATLDAVIGAHVVGQTAVVLSANYAGLSSFLLCWSLLLSLFRCSSSEQRVRYATFIRRASLLDELLSAVFRLLPDSSLSNTLVSIPSSTKVAFFILVMIVLFINS